MRIPTHFLACLYEVKECLCDIHGERALACVCDQYVQFMGLSQFLSNYKG